MKEGIIIFAKKILPKSILSSGRRLNRRIKYRKYSGKGVKCPICKSEYSIFAPFGSPQRQNALCPNCGSLERHRLMWLYYNKKTSLFGDEEINLLHFAPEEVFYSTFSSRININYYPVDLFPELFKYDGKVDVEKADITSLPFESNFFDVIICNHVLEHIEDDKLAMSELYRVLNKEKGWGVFQVPIDYAREETYEDLSITDPKEREKAFGQKDHVRWYGKDYENKLKGQKFKVDVDNFIESFSESEIFKYGLDKEELIYRVATN